MKCAIVGERTHEKQTKMSWRLRQIQKEHAFRIENQGTWGKNIFVHWGGIMRYWIFISAWDEGMNTPLVTLTQSMVLNYALYLNVKCSHKLCLMCAAGQWSELLIQVLLHLHQHRWVKTGRALQYTGKVNQSCVHYTVAMAHGKQRWWSRCCLWQYREIFVKLT